MVRTFWTLCKTFYITQNLELYITWKLMKFLITYVHDVHHQSILAILLHHWHFYFASKIPAVSDPERQVPDRSGTNEIAGFLLVLFSAVL